MIPSDKPTSSQTENVPPRRSAAAKSTIGGAIVVVLVVLYAFLQPVLNDQLGTNLPPVKPVAEASSKVVETPADGVAESTDSAGDDTSDQADLLYGVLREIAPKRYLSKAGLEYTPGSAEGHRLEHLRRHTKDDKKRPVHGVFDGEMPGALQTIDRAYERAKKGQRTTRKTEGSRMIYTVDMGARVGYVGGREGVRKRNPMARRVRLVLEGNRFITAFPL